MQKKIGFIKQKGDGVDGGGGEGGRTLSKAPALQQGKPSPTLDITISILNSKLPAVYGAVTNKIIAKQMSLRWHIGHSTTKMYLSLKGPTSE